MVNKERYIEILTQVLNEYYNEIKRIGSGSKDRQRYIDGYLIAARALNVFGEEELQKLVDKIHFKAFGKTIQERRLSELKEISSGKESLNIPTYIREKISLKKK